MRVASRPGEKVSLPSISRAGKRAPSNEPDCVQTLPGSATSRLCIRFLACEMGMAEAAWGGRERTQVMNGKILHVLRCSGDAQQFPEHAACLLPVLV